RLVRIGGWGVEPESDHPDGPRRHPGTVAPSRVRGPDAWARRCSRHLPHRDGHRLRHGGEPVLGVEAMVGRAMAPRLPSGYAYQPPVTVSGTGPRDRLRGPGAGRTTPRGADPCRGCRRIARP